MRHSVCKTMPVFLYLIPHLRLEQGLDTKVLHVGYTPSIHVGVVSQTTKPACMRLTKILLFFMFYLLECPKRKYDGKENFKKKSETGFEYREQS